MNSKSTKHKFNNLKGRHFIMLGAMLLTFNVAFSNIFSPYCEQRRAANQNGCQTRLSIEEVRIEQGSDLIFRKAPDGCAGPFNLNTGTNSVEYGKVINNENNPVLLSAGGSYRVAISSSGRLASVNTAYAGAWIDLNANKSFIDGGEFLNADPTSWQVNSPLTNPGSLSYLDFTIPCNASEGISRIRISLGTNSDFVSQSACLFVQNTPYTGHAFGETEDLYIRILKSTTLAVDFVVPSSVFINSPITLVNINRAGFISHEWDSDLDGYDYTGTDFTTEFATTGMKDIKLRTTNCFGTDSVIKSVNVQSPSFAPSIDFVASRTNIEIGSEIILYDLSDNGPTSWDWQLNNPIQPAFDKSNIDGTPIGYLSKFNKVIFEMNDVGVFNVCLTASNSQGFASQCKNSYLNVTSVSEFRLGIGDNVTQFAQGIIYDRGGMEGNYSTGQTLGNPAINNLLIQPCGAEQIKLNVTQLKFADNAHALRVWDGLNSGGVPLHPQGGFNSTNSDAPFSVVAKSGFMYLELNTMAGSLTDSGLIANFEAILGQTTAPIPAFTYAVDGQTQAFRNAVTSFRSQSSNLFGLPSYAWSVDNVPVGPSSTSEGGRLLNYQFPTTGTYNVCLTVLSCAGDSMFCQNVTVVNPVGQTRLEFDADNVRPNIDEVVTFSTISDKASNFKWEIAPLDYELVAPSTLNSKTLEVKFKAPGPYRIQLRGWNTVDSAGTTRLVVKDSFIRVVEYCNITSTVLSSDVGNNLMQVHNSNNELVYSQASSSGQQGYQNFTVSSDPISVLLGGSYTITMARNSNFDKVSRAVFIDWNGDGNFDMNERVLYSYNSDALSYSQTFKVPDIDKVILGPLRMRAIVSYSTTPINACQDVSAGEVEDYRIWLYPSQEAPEITMLGQNLVYMPLNGTYSDAGATATDPIEGDVTYRIQTTTNLNANNVGMYYVRYNLTNATKVAAQQKERIIIVTADNEAPIITMLGNNPDYLEAGTGAYIDPGVTAFDNADGDVSPLVVKSGSVNHLQLGTYQIVYSVNDASGNNAMKTRTVVVDDKTNPVINFVGETNIELGSVWTDMTFASDNFWTGSDLVLTKTFGFNGPVNPNIRGTYQVNYQATDASGNTTTLSRTYKVDDFVAPTIVLNTPDTILHTVNTTYTSVAPTIFDNYTKTDDMSIFKTGTVNPFVLGDYTELFRAIDEAGNKTEVTRFVRVVDNIAPTIATPYFCTQLYNVFNNKHGILLQDNYYSPEELLPLVDIVYSDVNIFFEGMYKAAYVVTDPSGNRSLETWRDIEVSADCKFISSVGNFDLERQVSVYPNPTAGQFEIGLGNLLQITEKVEIYNSVGEVVMTLNKQDLSSTVSLNISNFSSGVFIVKVSGADFSVTKKLILVK